MKKRPEAVTRLGTIHLRRRQIFTIFDPYPPTIGIPAKCLWRGFLILMYCDLWTIGTWGYPSPPKTCRRLKWMVPYVLCLSCTKIFEWYLCRGCWGWNRYRTFFQKRFIQGLVFKGILKGQESKSWDFFEGPRRFRGPQKSEKFDFLNAQMKVQTMYSNILL